MSEHDCQICEVISASHRQPSTAGAEQARTTLSTYCAVGLSSTIDSLKNAAHAAATHDSLTD